MLSLTPITLAAALLSPCAEPALSAGFSAGGQTGDAVTLYSAGLEGLLASPKDAALAEALRIAAPRLVALFEGHGVTVDAAALTLVHGLLTQPFCLRLTRDEQGQPFAQFTVQYEDEADAHWAAEILARLAGERGLGFTDRSEGAAGLVAMTPAGPLTIDAGTGPSGARLAVSLGGTLEETFSFTDTGLPDGLQPNFLFRFDGAQIGALVAPIVGMMGKENMPIVPMLLLETLGGPDAPEIVYASATSGSRGTSVLRFLGGAAAARRAGTLVEEPLSSDDFARIPADATWARMAQWRPSSYLGLLDRIQPGMAGGVIGQVRAMTGVDLRTDFLDHIGPTLSAYTSRSTGGGVFSAVALIETDDAAAVASSIERLWQAVAPMIAAQTDGRVDVRTWDAGGKACATIVFPGLPIPVEPSFAAADGVIVCALGRGALAAAVEQLDRDKGLADHARLASMPGQAYDGLAGFGFYDTPRFVLDGYGTLAIGAGTLANALHEQGGSDELFANVLPTPRTLAAKVRPSVSFVRINGDDIIETTSRDASFLVRCGACFGGPLGGSQVLSLSIPIVAAVAIPNLMTARLSANENAAIATLRSLSAAQAQFQATGLVDTDGDGGGEYGFIGELCGSAALRVRGAAGGIEMGSDLIAPPMLPLSFTPQVGSTGAAVTVRSGYVYQVWLPSADLTGVCEAADKRSAGGSTSPDNAELFWCVYAWPLEFGKTGRRAFCVTQDGDIVALDNDQGSYWGLPGADGGTPGFDAALAPTTKSDGWQFAMDERFGPGVCQGADGNIWMMVGR